MRLLTWVSDGTFTGVAALKEIARPAAAWWVSNRNWTMRVRRGDALRHLVVRKELYEMFIRG